ncbi:MAG: hypothetical protein HN838_17800 [Rhodospirillaceae bacterium]|nr:hypothetical protein [Rhodospirillaceae bacterium]
MIERRLLFELCIGLHDRADAIPQYMADRCRVSGIYEVMDFAGKASEQVSVHDEPSLLEKVPFYLLR